MRRNLKVVFFATAVIAASVAGTGLAAWATITVTASGTVTGVAAPMPTVAAPTVKRTSDGVRIDWSALAGASVDYVVTRFDPEGQEACRVRSPLSKCTDKAATPGTTVAYSVTAWGPHGPLSAPGPRSEAVEIPAQLPPAAPTPGGPSQRPVATPSTAASSQPPSTRSTGRAVVTAPPAEAAPAPTTQPAPTSPPTSPGPTTSPPAVTVPATSDQPAQADGG